MIRPRASAAIPLAILVLAGCDTLWNWANRGDLERDVVGLLRRHGMEAREAACHMVGTTRAGVCAFRGHADQVAGVVRGLGLAAVESSQAVGGCPSGAGATTFRSDRRPPELRLPNGSAFEYLVLHRGAADDRMCVQVEYSYG